MDWLGILIGAAAGYTWRGPVGAAVGAGVVAVISQAGKAKAAETAETPRRFTGAPVIVLQAPTGAKGPAGGLTPIERDLPADQIQRNLARLGG